MRCRKAVEFHERHVPLTRIRIGWGTESTLEESETWLYAISERYDGSIENGKRAHLVEVLQQVENATLNLVF